MPSFINKFARGVLDFTTGGTHDVDLAATSAGSFDPEYSFPNFSLRYSRSNNVRANSSFYNAKILNSGDTLRFTRNNVQTGAVSLAWEITELNPAYFEKVVVGTVVRDGPAKTIINLTGSPYRPVDPSRSFIVVTTTTSNNSLASTRESVRAYFEDGGDTLVLESNSAPDNTCEVVFYVVEAKPSSGITVEHGVVKLASGASGDRSKTQILNKTYDLERTFLINQGVRSGTTFGSFTRDLAMVRFIAENEVEASRSFAGSTQELDVGYAVVELPEDTGKVVNFFGVKPSAASAFNTISWAALDPAWTTYPRGWLRPNAWASADGSDVTHDQIDIRAVPEDDADGIELTTHASGTELEFYGSAVQWSWEDGGGVDHDRFFSIGGSGTPSLQMTFGTALGLSYSGAGSPSIAKNIGKSRAFDVDGALVSGRNITKRAFPDGSGGVTTGRTIIKPRSVGGQGTVDSSAILGGSMELDYTGTGSLTTSLKFGVGMAFGYISTATVTIRKYIAKAFYYANTAVVNVVVNIPIAIAATLRRGAKLLGSFLGRTGP